MCQVLTEALTLTLTLNPMGSAVGSFHYPNGLQRLVLLCWLLVVCFELGFAETQVKWVPAKGNNEDRGGRPPLPYSQRKLDEVRLAGINVFILLRVGLMTAWWFCIHLRMLTVQFSEHCLP